MSLQMSATYRIQIQTLQLNLNLALQRRPGVAEGGTKSPNVRSNGEDLSAWNGMLSACPDIVDYAKGGIVNWRDFLATAAVVRPMLGISPSAWEGQRDLLWARRRRRWWWLACCSEVLRSQSAGGYLRELTRKAWEREFSLGPVLMAQNNARNREPRSACWVWVADSPSRRGPSLPIGCFSAMSAV